MVSHVLEKAPDLALAIPIFIIMGRIDVVDAPVDDGPEEKRVGKRAAAEGNLGDLEAGPAQAAVAHAARGYGRGAGGCLAGKPIQKRTEDQGASDHGLEKSPPVMGCFRHGTLLGRSQSIGPNAPGQVN